MFKHHRPHTPDEEARLIAGLVTGSSNCIPLSRQRALARGAAPSAGEGAHIRECRRCNGRLEGLKVEMPAEAPEGSMRSRYGIMSTICGAIRMMDWQRCDFDNAWPILRDMIDGAMDAARGDAAMYPQVAAMYADAVMRSPQALKVLLVYGLTHLLESADAQPLAKQIAKQIAIADDPMAHAVLAMTIQSEGPELRELVPRDRWNELQSKTDGMVLRPLRRMRNEARAFDNFAKPHVPLEAIVPVVAEAVAPMLDDIFDSTIEPLRRVLHLLSLRAYFLHVARRMKERPNFAGEAVASIVRFVAGRRRDSGASMSLAIEAWDVFGRLPWVQPLTAAPPQGRPEAGGFAFENFWPARRGGHPRSAPAYAQGVMHAADVIKVKLVYELTYLLDSGEAEFAAEVAREIAMSDDEIAHRVLAMIVHTEGPELAELIPANRWTEIRLTTGRELAAFLGYIQVTKRMFDELMTPAASRDAIVELIDAIVMPMADEIFEPRNHPVRRALALLAVRDCLAHASRGAAAADVLSEVEKLMCGKGSRWLALEACGRFSEPECACPRTEVVG